MNIDIDDDINSTVGDFLPTRFIFSKRMFVLYNKCSYDIISV